MLNIKRYKIYKKTLFHKKFPFHTNKIYLNHKKESTIFMILNLTDFT